MEMLDVGPGSATNSNGVGILWLQRILAAPFALLTLCLAMGGALLLAEVFQGDFKKLVPLIAVAAIGCISAALASSLLRGRGVPIWFLRGFWIAGVIGFSIAFVNECWRWIQGQPIDITGNLLLSGLGIYGVLSMFSVFWKRGR